LKERFRAFSGKPLEAVDFFDDGTAVRLKVTINPEDGSAILIFQELVGDIRKYELSYFNNTFCSNLLPAVHD